jgi:hypothetical protein
MKAYLVTTGSLFLLITAAHVCMIAEARSLAMDPWYIGLTLLALGLGVWAFRLLRSLPKA